MNCHIFGKNGRIGTRLRQGLDQIDCEHTSAPASAAIWLLAVPASAVPEILEQAQDRWVIDMSGYSKRAGIGHSGWDLENGLPTKRLIQNPGCIAASVILGLQKSGLAKLIHPLAPIQVTAICGKTLLHRSEDLSSPRRANRLWTHPHVDEIEAWLPDISISHFVPIIHPNQASGILTSITGQTEKHCTDRGQPVVLDQVIGTANVHWERIIHPDSNRFVLNVALDNLQYPVWHALQWLIRIKACSTV